MIDDLQPNILSVSQTCDQGHICIFDSKKCEIRRKDSCKLVGITVRTPRKCVYSRKLRTILYDPNWSNFAMA